VLILVHVLIAVHLWHWAARGETITPVEPSESMQTLERGTINAGFLLFVGTLLATAVFGRFFCGWACHLLALQDLCAWLLARVGLRPKPVRSRLLALIPLGAALYMFVWPTVVRIARGHDAPPLSWHLTTSDFWATFPGPVVSVLTFLTCGFLVVWWLGSKGFCTYGCPYGGFFAAVDKVAPGRILVNENCDGCAQCTVHCTSNVRVHEEVKLHKMVVDGGCMKCLDCVEVCPKGALRFGFAVPPVRKRPRRLYSFSWGEEIVLALTFVGALFVFRSLYGAVPFLFAIGIAVLASCAAILAFRLLRRTDVTWQHLRLRQAGRLTRAGRWAAIVLAVLGLFTTHSAVTQYSTWRGLRLLGQAMHMPPDAAQDAAVRDSAAHLERAASLGLLYDGRLEYGLAQLQSRANDFKGAEARLRTVLAHNPRDMIAGLTLANVVLMQDRLSEAADILRDVVKRDPSFRAAVQQLHNVEQMMLRRQ
jgi:polyferredoxin